MLCTAHRGGGREGVLALPGQDKPAVFWEPDQKEGKWSSVGSTGVFSSVDSPHSGGREQGTLWRSGPRAQCTSCSTLAELWEDSLLCCGARGDGLCLQCSASHSLTSVPMFLKNGTRQKYWDGKKCAPAWPFLGRTIWWYFA